MQIKYALIKCNYFISMYCSNEY